MMDYTNPKTVHDLLFGQDADQQNKSKKEVCPYCNNETDSMLSVNDGGSIECENYKCGKLYHYCKKQNDKMLKLSVPQFDCYW